LIELAMVRRMVRRASFLGPPVIAALWILGGSRVGVSAAIGLAMTLLNLWLAGRIIGGIAERKPHLLFVAGMAAFVLGLIVLTAIAAVLQALEVVDFVVTGLVLIISHLGLVLWEAAGAYDQIDTPAARRPDENGEDDEDEGLMGWNWT
jgi:hypothetical protein